ncbi:S8 family serine peptidase [Paenibacillus sp. 5J-6]|uniref:S8 family serine peptidase n=1 Tax=Paenibacillus silvestris TaxID=2606219 RepID=A0A6L8UY61_9BACL|nr:S8 family serine peptidase [Paenibacillus silvestris]MZQ83025.1 S8 family serine peptidase [Paenibacillus silvestris]
MYSNRRKTLTFLASFLIASSMVVPAYAEGTISVQGAGTDPNARLPKLKKSQWPTDPVTESSVQTDPQPAAIAAYEPPSNAEKTTTLATDRIIVKYKSNTLKSSALSNTIAPQVEEVKELSALNSKILHVKQNSNLLHVIDELSKDPNVLYAEPDFKLTIPQTVKEPISSNTQSKVTLQHDTIDSSQTLLPNDPFFSDQWYLHNTGQIYNIGASQYISTPGIDIQALKAWEITQGSEDVTVAVMSSGMEITNSDIASNIWKNSDEDPYNDKDDDENGYINDMNGWDFAHNDNTLYDPSDGFNDYRGTYYGKAIAAAINNRVGIAGVAPNIKLMPLKIFSPDRGYLSDAIEAINYAEAKGVKIAYLGWTLSEYSQALYEVISNSKMLFVTFAGPGDARNFNADLSPLYPKAYLTDNVLSVNSVDSNGQLGDSSSVGKTYVDVAAPGYLISLTGIDAPMGYAAEIHKYAGADNAEYKAIFNGIGFEVVPTEEGFDPKQRQVMFDRAMKFLDDFEANKDVKVLLVQDNMFDPFFHNPDDGPIEVPPLDPALDPTLAIYKDLLHNAGYSESNIDVYTTVELEDGPDLSTLQSHDIVVWFTGTLFASTLTLITDNDQANLTAYLNGGGHLMISGEDSIDGISSTPFVTDTLHLKILESGTVSGEVVGQPDTIYGNDAYLLYYFNEFVPNIVSTDSSITKINLTPPNTRIFQGGEDYAAVIAAGTAALVASEFPSMDAASIRHRIINSGTPLLSLAKANASGKMVNAFRALTSKDIPGTPLNDSTVTKKLSAGTSESDDVYAIELGAGESITATLTADAVTDFDLYLYDSTATTITSKYGIIAISENDSSAESITYTAKASGTYYINVSAYQGAGSYTLNLHSNNQAGMFQDTHSALAYSGNWSTISAKNGTFRQIDNVGSVEFGFRGNQIEWIGTKNPEQGIADVYIDGIKVASPSLYSKSTLYEQSLFKQSFANGHHMIKVVWTGKSDPSVKKAAHTYINVDAFKAATLMRSNDPTAIFNGLWGSSFNEYFSRGVQRFTETKDNSVMYTFSGSAVTLLANTGQNRGKANIYIDERLISTVDLYSPIAANQVPVFTTALTKGKHTLKVVHTGEKNNKSTGTLITIDALHFVE